MIEWLQNWYQNNCNGDWEHHFGIKIETLDNPGWNIEIDLEDTEIFMKNREYVLVEKSDNDWYGWEVKENKFKAGGDPQKLNFLISIFKEKINSNS